MSVENKGMLDFSSIKYERPDVDHFREVVQSTRLKLMSARDPEVAIAALIEYEKELSKFDTQVCLCNILHDLDTSNEFYADELDFYDEANDVSFDGYTICDIKEYEKILKEHRAFYDALLAEMAHVSWLGPVTPLVDVSKDFNPARARQSFFALQDCQIKKLNRFGIPAHYEYVKAGDGFIYLVNGTIAQCLSDEELKTVLSGKAVVDGYAAIEIARRGMASYLGCQPVPEAYRTSGETMAFAPYYKMRHQNNGSLPKLTEVAKDAVVLSDLKLVDRSTGETTYVAPGTILYKNAAGGTVVTRSLAVGVNRYNDEAPEIKMFLLEIFNRLEPGVIPFYVGEEQPVYFRCGKFDDGNGYLLALVNLSFDSLKNIPLCTENEVSSVEFLDGDGVYKPLKFKKCDGGVVIEKSVLSYEPVILRVR